MSGTATQHAWLFFSYHMYIFNTIKEVLERNGCETLWSPWVKIFIFTAASFIPYFLYNYNLTRIMNSSHLFFLTLKSKLDKDPIWHCNYQLHALITKINFTIPAGYPCREFLNIFIKIYKCLIRNVKVSLYLFNVIITFQMHNI